jgi:valyl-tRNA synthetase
MPFITEELWQAIEYRNDKESISISQYPEADASMINMQPKKRWSLKKRWMNIPPFKVTGG